MLTPKAVDGYLLSLHSENKSHEYIRVVTWDLERVKAHFATTPIDAISAEECRRYLLSFQESGNLSGHTIYWMYRNLNTFFNWCEREELLRDNPMRRVRPPQIPDTLPKVLTPAQIRKVFAYVKLDKSRLAKRDYTILTLLLDTGLRSGECARLTLDDVHLDHSFLLVRRGKGKKDRVIPLSNTLRKLLWRYLTHVRPLFYPPNHSLFFSRRGTSTTPHAIEEMCRRTLRRCNIPNGSAHIFRHTFATLYLRNGGDLERLRQILGHSSLTTTQIYLHLVPEDLIKRHNEISPLASVL